MTVLYYWTETVEAKSNVRREFLFMSLQVPFHQNMRNFF